MFQCWHSGTQRFAGEFFSAGTQALCCFQLSVSVLALWHSKVKGFLFFSFAVLALSHSGFLKECFNAGTEVLIGFQFSVSVLAKCNFGVRGVKVFFGE